MELTQVRTRRVRRLDLRLTRIRAGVRQTELAAEMEVGRSRVSQIEALYRPSAPTVARYCAALDRVRERAA